MLAGTVQATFGRRLRELRQRAGLSQEDLAYRAGLHRTYVSDVERGTRNVSLVTVARLAAALRLNASELVEGLGGAIHA